MQLCRPKVILKATFIYHKKKQALFYYLILRLHFDIFRKFSMSMYREKCFLPDVCLPVTVARGLLLWTWNLTAVVLSDSFRTGLEHVQRSIQGVDSGFVPLYQDTPERKHSGKESRQTENIEQRCFRNASHEGFIHCQMLPGRNFYL